MIPQSSHLGEIAHGGFAAVVLPVGVGGERGRRIESQGRGHSCELLRIQGQHLLHPHDYVQYQHGEAAEQQHGHSVFCPLHLVVFVHESQAVDEALKRPQHRIEKCALPFEYPRHEYSQGLGDREKHSQEDNDLQPAIDRHL